MEFFKTLTNARTQFNDAKESAYAYLGEKATDLHQEATATIKELDEGASYLNDKIRNSADAFVDETAQRNQQFYTNMKDDVKEKVSVVAEKVGMEDRGVAINKKIERGAEIVHAGGEAMADQAHEEIKNVGTLNRERKIAHKAINAVPTEKFENETVRQVSNQMKKDVKSVIDTKLTDIPADVAKAGVDVAALTVKAKVAMQDPIGDPTELKINETRTVSVDVKPEAHIGVGGGAAINQEYKTTRLGKDDFVATFKLGGALKGGIGKSLGEGVKANVGVNLGTSISIRGNAQMLAELKKEVKNGMTLDLENLKKLSPEEIKIGGDYRGFVGGSVVIASGKYEIGPGVKAVWNKKEGLHAELSANAKVSGNIGTSYGVNLSETRIGIPNFGTSYQMSGTIKTDGKIELKVGAQASIGGDAFVAEGKASVDLKALGMTKEEALELINKGQFNPEKFGIKLDVKVYEIEVDDKKSMSFNTPLGGTKNEFTTKKEIYAKKTNLLQKGYHLRP